MKWIVVLFLLVCDAPRIFACTACGFSDDSRGAFMLSSMILTFIPLIVLAAVFYFVYKKVKAFEDMDQKDRMADSDSDNKLSNIPTLP